MKKSRKQASISKLNSKILKVAEKISKAVELEAEEILEHAEDVVKKFVPAKYVKRTLEAIEKAVEKEGVEALFNKAVKREALLKTASETPSKEEIEEVVKEIVKAIVDEFEDVLEDADETADEEIKKIAEEFDFEDLEEVEAKLKGVLERSLHAKGIYARFARNFKQTKKMTIAEKIRMAQTKMKRK